VKEPPLDRRVLLERVVVVEMVLCEIRERGGGELHGVDAMQGLSVARDLHRHATDPTVAHLGE